MLCVFHKIISKNNTQFFFCILYLCFLDGANETHFRKFIN